MLDLINEALAIEGFVWICLATFVAGAVRGFSGFGAAMIYLPVAGQFLDPLPAIISLLVMDTFGPLPALPRVMRDADWPDLRRLVLGMVIAMPFGIGLLLLVEPQVFRYAVSAMSLLLLVILVLGLRYQGRLSAGKVVGVGAAGGFLGGAVGLPGPPVIMFYMASTHAAPVIRATTMLYLLAFDLGFISLTALQGVLSAQAVMLGLVLVPAALLGTICGTWLFRPAHERLYRGAAYMIIAVSALRGLPLWEG